VWVLFLAVNCLLLLLTYRGVSGKSSGKRRQQYFDLTEIAVAFTRFEVGNYGLLRERGFFFIPKMPKLQRAASSYTTVLLVGTPDFMGQRPFQPVHASASSQVVSMCLVQN
jgi:hypothetical protein